MFGDDCIIFCKATKKATREIKYVLDHYCKVSSQLINYHKSIVQFSIYVEKCGKTNIADILQIQTTTAIGSYVGCPNIYQPCSRELILELEERSIKNLLVGKPEYYLQ